MPGAQVREVTFMTDEHGKVLISGERKRPKIILVDESFDIEIG